MGSAGITRVKRSTATGLVSQAGGKGRSMADGDIHVVKSGDEWTLTLEGIKGNLVSFDTEDEARLGLTTTA
jgi:hypothetical protein